MFVRRRFEFGEYVPDRVKDLKAKMDNLTKAARLPLRILFDQARQFMMTPGIGAITAPATWRPSLIRHASGNLEVLVPISA